MEAELALTAALASQISVACSRAEALSMEAESVTTAVDGDEIDNGDDEPEGAKEVGCPLARFFMRLTTVATFFGVVLASRSSLARSLAKGLSMRNAEASSIEEAD